MLINKKIKQIKLKRKLKQLKNCGNNIHIGENFCTVGAEYITIGKNFSAGRNLYLQAWASYRGKFIGGGQN